MTKFSYGWWIRFFKGEFNTYDEANEETIADKYIIRIDSNVILAATPYYVEVKQPNNEETIFIYDNKEKQRQFARILQNKEIIKHEVEYF